MGTTVSETAKPNRKSQWDRVAEMDEFRLLLLAKVGFVLPATIFFLAYYFALLVLVGYFPAFMEHKIWGEVNIAYVFALSQFLVAWIIAFLYVRAAKRFDEYGSRIIQRLEAEGKVKVSGE
jgi:uncharacterized membrane protein (DUF485 family)